MHSKPFCSALFLFFLFFQTRAQQTLSMQEALRLAGDNYRSIKAKRQYAEAAESLVQQARKEALPNLIVSAQQDYGTVNGQNGPLYGLGGFGVASSGLPLPAQNWNAAFGALYLAHINWELFSFGKVRERIKTAEAAAARDESDLQQEVFQHRIRVAAAYLNLMAAQRLALSQRDNLSRADTLRKIVTTRALNGLVAGVDSSLANAEVSNARSAFILAKDTEQERAAQLAFLLGVPVGDFLLDTVFISSIPAGNTADAEPENHPLLDFYRKRMEAGNSQAEYLNTLKWPTFSLFGILQSRASGFFSNYAVDQSAFTHDYWEGIKPSRSNYLLGLGVVWNITNITRVNKQVAAQRFVVAAMEEEYGLARDQLKMQENIAVSRMRNALANFREAPRQVNAASEAFQQKKVLYRNGLATMVDVSQTLFTLNRAETNRDIAYNNVWQALLLAAAASGDLSGFLNELK